jgi:hypothetical protein
MSQQHTPVPPQYDLTAYDRASKARGNIGVAWVNQETGVIKIKLNPGASMTYADQVDRGIIFTLFKKTPQERQPGQENKRRIDTSDSRSFPDDDIPF